MENKKVVIGSLFHGNYGKKLFDYLAKLAWSDRDIEWDDTDNCDFIVRSVFIYENRQLNNVSKPWIAWSGEPRPVQYNPAKTKPFLTVNTFKDIGTNVFHVPFMAFSNFDWKNPRKYTNLERPYLVAYCYSNPIPLREKFFRLIKEKDNTAHGLGRCNTTKGFGRTGMKWKDNPEIYKDYRFVIAMENTNSNGYVTEKILNAFMGGAIPIYWGNSKYVQEIFNPMAYIDLSDFSCVEACIEYVLDLDKDKERRERMMKAPIFKNNITPDILRIGDFENVPEIYKNMAQILQDNITLT
jgi:hypothetical protein